MTRKDYEMIAYRLRMAKPSERRSEDARDAWADCCREVAGGMERENRAFDSTRFLTACGL